VGAGMCVSGAAWELGPDASVAHAGEGPCTDKSLGRSLLGTLASPLLCLAGRRTGSRTVSWRRAALLVWRPTACLRLLHPSLPPSPHHVSLLIRPLIMQAPEAVASMMGSKSGVRRATKESGTAFC